MHSRLPGKHSLLFYNRTILLLLLLPAPAFQYAACPFCLLLYIWSESIFPTTNRIQTGNHLGGAVISMVAISNASHLHRGRICGVVESSSHLITWESSLSCEIFSSCHVMPHRPCRKQAPFLTFHSLYQDHWERQSVPCYL